jgi:hypothetical protein
MAEKIIIIIEELFYVLTVALLIFVVLEIFKARLILNYLNINILLIVWFTNAIILLLIKNKNTKI